MQEELEKLEELKNQLILFFVERGTAILVALIIFAVGIWIARRLSGFIIAFCGKKSLDSTLARFFAGTAKLIIVAVTCMIALEKVGIQITPFIALLGAGAFGLSLAVQGPISNYGAGIVIIITRPYKIGDTLAVNSFAGIVRNIRLGATELINEDDECITIPNRKVLGEVLTNSYAYTKYEGVVGIEYSADPEKAISAIREALKGLEGVANDREPDIGIDAFADSSINIAYRVLIQTGKLHPTRYRVNLAVYHALKKAGLSIPFPQRDVHLIGGGNTK